MNSRCPPLACIITDDSILIRHVLRMSLKGHGCYKAAVPERRYRVAAKYISNPRPNPLPRNCDQFKKTLTTRVVDAWLALFPTRGNFAKHDIMLIGTQSKNFVENRDRSLQGGQTAKIYI